MRLTPKRFLICIAFCLFLTILYYHRTDSSQDDQADQYFDHTNTHPKSISQLPDQNSYQNQSFAPQTFSFMPTGTSVEKHNLEPKQEPPYFYPVLWPEDTNTSDRILAQMELSWQQIKTWHDHIHKNFRSDHDQQKLIRQRSINDHQNSRPLVIYLQRKIRSWNVQPGKQEFKNQQCPVQNCFLTDLSSALKMANAVVFRDRIPLDFQRRSADQIWIFYTLESPHNTPSLLNFNDKINWTATYRYDSDLVTPYQKWRAYSPDEFQNRKVVSEQINYAKNKSKQVAWFVSHCLTSNNRLAYAKKLQKHIQVDIVGECGAFSCSRGDSRCGQKLDRDYRFYLAFENSNCQDYITEKFFERGLQHIIIPIVMGARKSEYTRIAPPNSFIHVDDFDTPAHLASYLHLLSQNDTLYNEYFKWKGTGEFIDTKFWCRLCAMLHAPRRKSYQNLEEWWRKPGTCSKGKWSK